MIARDAVATLHAAGLVHEEDRVLSGVMDGSVPVAFGYGTESGDLAVAYWSNDREEFLTLYFDPVGVSMIAQALKDQQKEQDRGLLTECLGVLEEVRSAAAVDPRLNARVGSRLERTLAKVQERVK